MLTLASFVTVNGSAYTFTGAFGQTFVTRISDHGIDGVDTSTQTVPCEGWTMVPRLNASGVLQDALMINGGPLDRVITGVVVAAGTLAVGA